MNASKVQAHTIVKNIRKKQNDQIQISATHRFYSQKKQAPTRATKLTKKLHQDHKTNWFCQNNVYKNPGAQEESKQGKENCEKLASDTEANLHTTKRAKVRNST